MNATFKEYTDNRLADLAEQRETVSNYQRHQDRAGLGGQLGS
jgi:hypothetical protein